jgi:hypothetical protein
MIRSAPNRWCLQKSNRWETVRVTMHDVTAILDDRPGALAEFGEALGRAGLSVEGGGAWVAGGAGVAHFLVADGEAARRVLAAAQIEVAGIRDVLLLRLRQDEPGQLGKIARRMAAAGVNIETVYSDHAGQLVLVVDRPDLGRAVADSWTRLPP